MSNIFKSSFGLSSGNNPIEEVADPINLSDAVNLKYFRENNSIQEYNPTQGYKKGIIISYKFQLYQAEVDIAAPAGEFNYSFWNDIQQYGKWINVSNTTPENIKALPGEMYLVNTLYNDSVINLPTDPVAGDYILVKDAQGFAGLKTVLIKQSTHILSNGEPEFFLSIPYETSMFVFDVVQQRWNIHRTNSNFISKPVRENSETQPIKLQAQDTIIDPSITDFTIPIYLEFPLNIHNKEYIKLVFPDFINTVDLVVSNPNHTIGNQKLTHVVLENFKSGFLIFNKDENNWQILSVNEKIIFAESVTLNKHKITISKNTETYQLSALVLPEETTDKSLTWISLDNDIIEVDQTGLVSGVKNGIGWLVVLTKHNKSDICEVTIITTVESIDIIKDQETLWIPKLVEQVELTTDTITVYVPNPDFNITLNPKASTIWVVNRVTGINLIETNIILNYR